MGQRHIMQIELSSVTKRKFDAIRDHHRMTQVAMMSRIVKWLSEQDPSTQLAILGNLPAGFRQEVVRIVLRKMAYRPRLASTQDDTE